MNQEQFNQEQAKYGCTNLRGFGGLNHYVSASLGETLNTLIEQAAANPHLRPFTKHQLLAAIEHGVTMFSNSVRSNEKAILQHIEDHRIE